MIAPNEFYKAFNDDRVVYDPSMDAIMVMSYPDYVLKSPNKYITGYAWVIIGVL